jgi:hypothetical protein
MFGVAMTRDIERHLSLYDGRDRLGVVIQRNGRCDAFDIQGVYLGLFPTLKAAIAAVNTSLSCSCVSDFNARRDNSE